MHKILEFILAAAIIMSVLVAVDYIVRLYVSSSQPLNKYLKTSVDVVGNSIADYLLETPGIPKEWGIKIYRLVIFQPGRRVGLSFVNSSIILNPLKIYKLMTCNTSIYALFFNPLLNAGLFSQVMTGSDRYGIRLSIRNYFNATIRYYCVNNSLMMYVDQSALGGTASVVEILKCLESLTPTTSIYVIRMFNSTIEINSTQISLPSIPTGCELKACIAAIENGNRRSITYYVDNNSIAFIPLLNYEQPNLTLYFLSSSSISLTSATKGKPLENETLVLYFIPSYNNPVINLTLGNLHVINQSSLFIQLPSNAYIRELLYLDGVNYSIAMHTVVIEFGYRVSLGGGVKVFNVSKVFIVPLYPYMRMLCGGTYGLPPPMSGIPVTTINRVVKVGLFDYVFNIKVWVMRS